MKMIARVFAVLAVATATDAAGAQTFTGFTQGCFYVSPGTCTATNTASLAGTGLSFSNDGTFSVTGSSPLPLSGVNSLGSFTVVKTTPQASNAAVPANTFFDLLVSFTSPAGTTPSPETFTASLSGRFSAPNDVLTLNFDNTSHLFTYSGGTFELTIDNDIVFTKSGNAGDTERAEIQGTLTFQSTQVPGTTVPEPSTYVLMASGLAALGFAARRRRA